MRKIQYCLILSLSIFIQTSYAQDAFTFFRGQTFPPARATPAAWLVELAKADSIFNFAVAVAEFLPNTRLAWHNHPGGQILLITDGVGYYQEKGKQKQIVRKGDVIKCLPGVEHWHGASVESGMTYIAVSPAQKGPTIWAQQVSDEDYKAIGVDQRTFPMTNNVIKSRPVSLTKAEGTIPLMMNSVKFEMGKKSNWIKNSGQILIVMDGTGYYQEKGKTMQVLKKGDVIKCLPGVEHWYGSSAENSATFVEINPEA